MNVAGDKQIEPAITVVVTPSGARRPVPKSDSSLLRDVGEGSVVIVMVKAVLSVVTHENVRPAVVVVVCYSRAETPAIIGHACFGRYIGKCTVVIVVEQRGVWRRLLALHRIEGRAVNQINVQPAVVVVVDQSHSRAVGVDDQLLVRRTHPVVPSGEASWFCDVFEDN